MSIETEPEAVVSWSELLSPLVDWGDGLFGAALQNGAFVGKPDENGEWEELRVETWPDGCTVIYAPDEASSWEAYRGRIPDRDFWLALLRNASVGGFRGVGGNGDNDPSSATAKEARADV